MSFTKDKELVKLRNSLDALMNGVKELHLEEKPYFYRFLDHMKNNIEICICMERAHQMKKGDWDCLDEILRRDWEEANREDTGIPAYDRILSGQKWGKCLCGISYVGLLLEIDAYFYGEEEFRDELVYNMGQK